MQNETIPRGLCQCGCGSKTTLAARSDKRDGTVKGEPVRFVRGHGTRRPAAERFWRFVDKGGEGGCWIWTGAIRPNGYGQFNDGTRIPEKAHRFAYELVVGPIPEGLQIDHLCRVRACVNPAHLEPVTQQENIRRGEAGQVVAQIQRDKTHCPQGHPYDEENTLHCAGRRHCRACQRERNRLRIR